MRQAEKVFKMIHDYCKENLSISHNMLDKHIEDLMNPEIIVSPLLKYFDDLARDCHFRLPSKALLEFDQRYFRKYLKRVKDAQIMEVKWVKNTIIDETKKYTKNAFT